MRFGPGDLVPEFVSGATGPEVQGRQTVAVPGGSRTLTGMDNPIDRLDQLPFMPARIADRALRRLYDRRKAAAASDPEWADIEARRRSNGFSSILLSRDAGLGWPEWQRQRAIEDELVPDPFWADTARAVARYGELGRAVAEVRFVAQRVRRGWADRDLWNAGSTMALRWADMLDELARISSGWPSDHYPTFESWQEQLRTVAADLRGDTVAERAATARWAAASQDPSVPETVTDALLSEISRLEADNRARRTTALHWIADHHDYLWD